MTAKAKQNFSVKVIQIDKKIVFHTVELFNFPRRIISETRGFAKQLNYPVFRVSHVFYVFGEQHCEDL